MSDILERAARQARDAIRDQGFIDEDGTAEEYVRRYQEAAVVILAALRDSGIGEIVEAAERVAEDTARIGLISSVTHRGHPARSDVFVWSSSRSAVEQLRAALEKGKG